MTYVIGGPFIDRKLGAAVAVRFRGGVREPRIQFRDAIPVRRDRRDLRRRLRRTTRAAMSERQAQMTVVLRHLSADHVPLAGVIPGAEDTSKIVVFADGTRLLLAIRCGRGGLERLGQDGSGLPVRLANVQPCFGRRWFWLWFTSSDRTAVLEVLARVSPVPCGRDESRSR